MISRGFSLIELMIVVAIIGILAAFSYSNYSESIARSKRAEGKAALLELAQRMERYYSENNTYVGASDSFGGSPLHSPEGYYTLTIRVPDPNTGRGYLLTATPQNKQKSTDTACQSLTYSDLGVEGIMSGPSGAPPSATASHCWSR